MINDRGFDSVHHQGIMPNSDNASSRVDTGRYTMVRIFQLDEVNATEPTLLIFNRLI